MNSPTVSPMPATEAEIVEAVVSNLGRLGKISAVGLEVPSHGRSRADVAALVGDDLVLIEAKRTAWQRVLAQAALNRLCSDRSYIALWSGRVTDGIKDEAARLGVGILSVNEDILVIELEAMPKLPRSIVRQSIIDRIQGAQS